MKSFEYTIKDELGIHARPAGMLVKRLRNIRARLPLQKKEKQQRLLSLWRLCL